jgi:H+/Cl- antiporter ClcA
VALAAAASIGGGLVLGPEAPLIAIGGGLGFIAVGLLRRDTPEQLGYLIAASGTFAAISFLFGSPLIAAVLLVEAAAPGKDRLPVLLIPGMLASGIGWLVSLGLGSWTGVDTDNISISLLDLPAFARPDVVDFLWTVPLAAVVALGAVAIFRGANALEPLVERRRLFALPAIGLVVAGLAIAFSELADKGVDQVLYSGQTAIGTLVADSGSWSLAALALVIVCKGLAYSLSLAGFRGGPVFPALFLGAAAGVMAAHLPGFELTPAVAVGLGAATAAVLRLPLSAVVLATLLTSQAGIGAGPLIIVGVVVAYLVALAVSPPSPTTAVAGDAA